MGKVDFQTAYKELSDLVETEKAKKERGEKSVCFYDPPPYFHWTKEQIKIFQKKYYELTESSL